MDAINNLAAGLLASAVSQEWIVEAILQGICASHRDLCISEGFLCMGAYV